DLVPWEKDPAKGYISTANNDPIGDTLDNDPSNGALPDGTPMYTACQFDMGMREGRIHTRIEGHEEPFNVNDLADIQGDVRSSMGAAIGQTLIDALDRAKEEKAAPGTHPDLTAVVADPTYSPTIMKA